MIFFFGKLCALLWWWWAQILVFIFFLLIQTKQLQMMTQRVTERQRHGHGDRRVALVVTNYLIIQTRIFPCDGIREKKKKPRKIFFVFFFGLFNQMVNALSMRCAVRRNCTIDLFTLCVCKDVAKQVYILRRCGCTFKYLTITQVMMNCLLTHNSVHMYKQVRVHRPVLKTFIFSIQYTKPNSIFFKGRVYTK